MSDAESVGSGLDVGAVLDDIDYEGLFEGTALSDEGSDSFAETVGRLLGERIGRVVGEVVGSVVGAMVVPGMLDTPDEGGATDDEGEATDE